MEKRLYDSARNGSVSELLELLNAAPSLLDRCNFGIYVETPLHVAAMLGHVEFVKEILLRKPDLASEEDLDKSTPLHLASATNNVEMITLLFNAAPSVCRKYDGYGRNPVHVAALRGRIDVLKSLLQLERGAAEMLTAKGESILHLCVRFDKFEALQVVLQHFGLDCDLLKSLDRDGNSVLHLAVLHKQSEVVNFLLQSTSIDVNAKNFSNHSALDILYMKNDDAIGRALLSHGAILTSNPAVAASAPLQLQQPPPPQSQPNKQSPFMEFIKEKQEAVMIAASLIAAAAFQAGVNPPGGVYQDTVSTDGGPVILTKHKAGTSIVAYSNPPLYITFIVENSIGFIASLSVFLLLLTGLPYKHKFFKGTFMVTVWIGIFAIGASYFSSIITVAPPIRQDKVVPLAIVGLVISAVLWIVIILWYVGIGPRIMERLQRRSTRGVPSTVATLPRRRSTNYQNL